MGTLKRDAEASSLSTLSQGRRNEISPPKRSVCNATQDVEISCRESRY